MDFFLLQKRTNLLTDIAALGCSERPALKHTLACCWSPFWQKTEESLWASQLFKQEININNIQILTSNDSEAREMFIKIVIPFKDGYVPA